MMITGLVSLLQANIAVLPKVRHTWWSILEEAARERQLRRLVHNALSDPTISAYHDDIRNILDVPERELYVDNAIKAENRSKFQKGYLPTTGSRAALWPLGHTLKIRFLDGEPALHEKVERAASQWVDYANLKLDFGEHPDAELRVSFKMPGSWAYTRTISLSVPNSDPNINFGWLTSSTCKYEIQWVVLHEFGHVLGFQHEHGNPASNLA